MEEVRGASAHPRAVGAGSAVWLTHNTAKCQICGADLPDVSQRVWGTIGVSACSWNRAAPPTIPDGEQTGARCRGPHEEVLLQEPERCHMNLQIPWFRPAAWGVVVGSIATMFVGFTWLGWTLGSTAERMAAERTNAAVFQSPSAANP